MSKRSQLSDFERGEIIELWKGGHSERNIESILQHPKSTIHDIITSYKNKNQITAIPQPGRPPKITERDVRHLIKIVKEDRQQSLNEITEKFKDLSINPVCQNTVRSVLHSEGFFGRAGKRKPLVSEVNRKKRLEWCRERRNWDSEWDSIIWSDESRFLLFQNDAHHWVWRRPHEKFDVNCLIPTVKSGNQGVMVWGCFAKDRLGPLIQVPGRITGSEILVNLVESMPRRVQAVIDSRGNPTRYLKIRIAVKI